MIELQENTLVCRTQNVFFNKLDDEIVMMSPENGEYYGLDATASAIWELIENPVTVAGIVTHLLATFDVDKETCQRDVALFLENLCAKKLITLT